MNICLITPNVFPVPAVKGGACETLVETIIKENEKLNKLNLFCVSIYDEEAYVKSKQFKNTEFIYIEEGASASNIDLSFNNLDQKFIYYMDKIYEKIKNLDLDFIIIEGGDLKGYQYLLKRFPKNKCIAHLHGNTLAEKEIDETYQYFLAVSNFVANKLTENGMIKHDRVKTLYNGIEISKFKKRISLEEKQEIKNRYKIKDNERVIMFCGRTVINKGVKELILAFKKIKNIKNAKLIIVGNSLFSKNVQTEYDKELLEISEDIKDKVIFTGFKHNDELYKIHNIVDIAVVPTINEEPFGMVIVEAMASGLPLIVTKSGAIPEIVNEKSAIILEKNENLEDNIAKYLDILIESKNKRQEMGHEGSKLSEKFSNDNYYKNFVNIINELYIKNNIT